MTTKDLIDESELHLFTAFPRISVLIPTCNSQDDISQLVDLLNEAFESAWEFRRLSRLGERMESWKRSELDIRGIRLS
jgi:hypothetical protein